MSELRHDPVQKRWVIIATERASRPQDFHLEKGTWSGREVCPFCPGHEEATPPQIRTFPNPDRPGQWLVRVVSNKFPALRIEGDLDRAPRGSTTG